MKAVKGGGGGHRQVRNGQVRDFWRQRISPDRQIDFGSLFEMLKDWPAVRDDKARRVSWSHP